MNYLNGDSGGNYMNVPDDIGISQDVDIRVAVGGEVKNFIAKHLAAGPRWFRIERVGWRMHIRRGALRFTTGGRCMRFGPKRRLYLGGKVRGEQPLRIGSPADSVEGLRVVRVAYDSMAGTATIDVRPGSDLLVFDQ